MLQHTGCLTLFPMGVQVMELKAIRRRYLRGWASIDLAAAIPWDLVMLACGDTWVGKLQVPPCRNGR